MDGFADVERLRLQHVSLQRKLHENQHELRHSVQSAKGSVSSLAKTSPIKEHSEIASNLNSGQMTSTPKYLPPRTYQASPTHRARTEILDTTPQEILSDSSHIDVDRFRHMSTLGPCLDQSRHVHGYVPSRTCSSAKKNKLGSSKQRRRKGRVAVGKVRRSPRNTRHSPRHLSTVSAPPADRTSHQTKQLLSQTRNMNHRVLNRSGVNFGQPTTGTPKRPQSASCAEQSPPELRRRHSQRRPNSATPKFNISQMPSRQDKASTQQYQSQFLNSYYANEHESNSSVVEEVRVRRSQFPERLLDDGNVRRTPNLRVRDTTPRPKSILLTPANKCNKAKNNSMRVSFRESPNTSSVSMRQTGHLDDSGHVQPLLGYDWIAGLLDTDRHASEKTEGYLAELQEFRRNNYEDCVHKSFAEGSVSQLSTSQQHSSEVEDMEIQEKQHKCIHNYTLNNRLFPVPLHGAESGESLCAICNSRRKLDSGRDSPSYIRVSVPRSTLRSPYQVRPHRRKSFDPTDSVGLSQHCLAGWENSVPSMMPAATNMDLKDSLGFTISQSQSLFMDREDATGQPSRTRRPLLPSTETQQLLNRSRSLKLELQKLERADLSKTRPSNRSQNSVL